MKSSTLALSIALCMGAFTEAQASTKPSAQPNGHSSVTRNAATAPAYNCDIREILKEVSLAYFENSKRNQFETKEEYFARVDRAILARMGTDKLKNITCEVSSEELHTKLSYNPEKKAIDISLSRDKNDLIREESDLGDIVAINTYGLSINAKSIKVKWYGIAWNKMNIDNPPSVPMLPNEAKTQWDDLSLAVTGDVESPYLAYEETLYRPTIEKPMQVKHERWYITFIPRKLILLNKKTSKIIKQWSLNDCNGYIHAWGKCSF